MNKFTLQRVSGSLRRLGERTVWRKSRNRPRFMIIGAQKAGTTSLAYYLDQHPAFSSSYPRETHYFDERIIKGAGVEWYESCFRGLAGVAYFDSTPAYLYRPGVAERIYKYSQDMKFVVILRDPVERAYSAYNHYRSSFSADVLGKNESRKGQPCDGNKIYELLYEGRDVFPDFRNVLEIELELMRDGGEIYDPSLIRRGVYLPQLRKYWTIFGKESVLIVGFKDLIYSPYEVLKKVADFIGVPGSEWGFVDASAKNVRPYVSAIKNEDRDFLEDFFSDHNHELIRETGPLNW